MESLPRAHYTRSPAAWLCGAAVSPSTSMREISSPSDAALDVAAHAREVRSRFDKLGVTVCPDDLEAERTLQSLVREGASVPDIVTRWLEISHRGAKTQLRTVGRTMYVPTLRTVPDGVLDVFAELAGLPGRFRLIKRRSGVMTLKDGALQFRVDIRDGLGRLATLFNVQLALAGRSERLYALPAAASSAAFALLDGKHEHTAWLIAKGIATPVA